MKEKLLVISEQEYDVYWINAIITEDKLDEYIKFYRNKIEKEQNIIITKIVKRDDFVALYNISNGVENCNYGFYFHLKEVNIFSEQ